MATGGIAKVVGDPIGYKPPAWTNPSNSIQGAYGAAVNTQAGDYDRLQGQFKNIFDAANAARVGNSNVTVPKVEAQQRSFNAIPTYSRTGAMDDVMSRLSDFADTGGYSNDDITAFRERGLSPIRAVYAAALRNLSRQKSIQGGYSPNYGAMQAKLAREQSGILGQHTMDLNANIAERVAEGKKFGVSQLAPLASHEQDAIGNIAAANAAAANSVENANVSDVNQANALNAQLFAEMERLNKSSDQNYMQTALGATSGAANLYGTTPALVNTFGNQVLASNNQKLAADTTKANINQDRANTGLNLLRLAPQPSAPASYTSPVVAPKPAIGNTGSIAGNNYYGGVGIPGSKIYRFGGY